MFTSACASYPQGPHEDDYCLQIAHQLKQFLTMLPSQYFDKFVSKNDTLIEIKFFSAQFHTNYFFFF